MIALWANTLAVVIILSFFVYDEIKRLKVLITPTVFFISPFILIIFITNFILVKYKYPEITPKVLWFLAIQGFIIWVIGLVFSHRFPVSLPRIKKITRDLSDYYTKFSVFFIFLGLFSSLMIIYKALSLFAAHGSWHYFGHSDYEKIMTKGGIAHLIHTAKISCFFLVLTYKKSKYKSLIWAVIFISLFAILMVQIKHHILHLILLLFLITLFDRDLKTQVKSLVTAFVLVVIIFNVFWVVLAYLSHIERTSTIANILGKYFINYLFTGTMNLDKWMTFSNIAPEWSPILTFRNLWNFLMGNPRMYDGVYYLSMEFTYIAPQMVSNVATAYGPFFLAGGWPFAVFYTIIISSLSQFFFYLTFSVKSIFVFFINIFLLVNILFTFFGAYALLISFFEVPIQLLLIILFLKVVNFLIEPKTTVIQN